MIPTPRAAPHECRARVRYRETDQMGVVYHSNYLVYFELGRTELLRSSGSSYRDLEDGGVLLAVTAAQVRFRAPARYDDELRIRTWVDEVGKASVRFRYEVWSEREGKLCAEGTTDLACLDRGQRPRRLPPDLESFLIRTREDQAR